MPKLTASGASDVGRQRQVNEDRFHVDAARGIFLVVDGVGGQAAGGKAADTAVAALRERLEQQAGSPADRIREAITAANNEIHRQAALRPEWQGMACVLTVAVVDGDRAVIGHVGDTRLYKLQGSRIEKVTPDHSPVGEREDANEISELEAMRHPRRNEVYRDVGSDAHQPADRDFISITQIDFPADAALLICSDGLTDLVQSEAIRQTVRANVGRPDDVARALVDAANAAGGKDNVTVVYVEGDAFTATDGVRSKARFGFAYGVIVTVLTMLAAFGAWQFGWPTTGPVARLWSGGTLVVRSSESIMSAIDRAKPGTTVLIEPGEYREQVTLKDDVRVLSRFPGGATLRLPSSAAESDPAVVVSGVTGAEFSGFRIVGDAASPLGIGVLVRAAGVRLVDLEVSGAVLGAIDFGAGDAVELIGSQIHDNPGAGLLIRSSATPRITQNVFTRNGTSERARGAFVVESLAQPSWLRNVFHNVDPQAFVGLDDSRRHALTIDNWFVTSRPASPNAPAAGRSGQAPQGQTSAGRRGR